MMIVAGAEHVHESTQEDLLLPRFLRLFLAIVRFLLVNTQLRNTLPRKPTLTGEGNRKK